MSDNVKSMLIEKELVKSKRANTILIETTYSQDGHYLESVSIKKPETEYEIFLLKKVLNSSICIKSWMEFDSNGNRIYMSEK